MVSSNLAPATHARRYIRQRKPFTFEFTAAWIAMKRRPPHSHSIVAGGLPEMS